MPQVKNVEKRISEIEGFTVKIIKDGKNVRGDASLPSQYLAKKMTKNSSSVNDFREKFKKQYPGYDCEIYKENDKKASGQTHLSTVRDTYLSE